MLTAREHEVLRRRARGENQQHIADALNISQAAVSRFETNAHAKILDAERLLKLCKTLGIRTEEEPVGERVIYKRRGGGQ